MRDASRLLRGNNTQIWRLSLPKGMRQVIIMQEVSGIGKWARNDTLGSLYASSEV
jgi:hypothetical protein